MERITQLLHHLGPENSLQMLLVNVNNPQKNAFVALQRMLIQNALLFEPQHMYVCMYIGGLTPVAFYVFLF